MMFFVEGMYISYIYISSFVYFIWTLCTHLLLYIVLLYSTILYYRGAPTNFHPGNEYFRDLVKQYQGQYLASKRADKPFIASHIVQIIQSRGGRFLRRHKRNGVSWERGHFVWVEVDPQKAYEKACQALREGAPEIRRKLRGSTSADSAEDEIQDEDEDDDNHHEHENIEDDNNAEVTTTSQHDHHRRKKAPPVVSPAGVSSSSSHRHHAPPKQPQEEEEEAGERMEEDGAKRPEGTKSSSSSPSSESDSQQPKKESSAETMKEEGPSGDDDRNDEMQDSEQRS